MSERAYRSYAAKAATSGSYAPNYRNRAINEVAAILNPYRDAGLAAEFRRGFYDSARDEDAAPRGRREAVAYGRGWNARRDARNVERFPLIETTADDLAVGGDDR